MLNEQDKYDHVNPEMSHALYYFNKSWEELV